MAWNYGSSLLQIGLPKATFINKYLPFRIGLLVICFSLPLLAFTQGTGADGALTVSGTSYTDGIKTTVSSTSNSGQSVINVSSSAGFTAGDIILVIQMTGTGIGQYEERTISNTGAGTITTSGTLIYTYTLNGSSAAQVIRIPQYTNVTINGGGTLTAAAWNGSTGGVCYFKANGTVTINGSLTVEGLGFSGGTAGGGGTGSASAGTGGSGQIRSGCTFFSGGSAGGDGLGGAGGAGDCAKGRSSAGACVCFYAGETNGFSGGGASAISGNSGASGTAGSGPGAGAANSGGGSYTGNSGLWGSVSGAGLTMGSGGGGGAGGNGGNGSGPGGGGGAGSFGSGQNGGDGSTGATGGNGGNGGNGGGILRFVANATTGTGVISAKGIVGSNGTNGNAGAIGGNGGNGGTGSGCACSNFSKVYVGGGGGGGNGGLGADGGNGGGGGAGGSLYIVVQSGSFSGVSSSAAGGGGAIGSGGAAGTQGSRGTGPSWASGGSCTNCTNSPYNIFASDGGDGAAGSSGSNGSTTGGSGSGGGAVLPVSLLEFGGKSESGVNHIWWCTSAEQNNNFFSIEKNKEEFFYLLSTVKGSGNHTGYKKYDYFDEVKDSIGSAFYRLSQTDYNGQHTNLGIISIKPFDFSNKVVLSILNNPVANGVLSINLQSSADEDVSLTINNTFGLQIIKEKIFLRKNEIFHVGMDLKNVAPGIYIINITERELIGCRKFLLLTNTGGY